MFALLRSRSNSRWQDRFRRRLEVEALEARDCPASLTVDAVVQSGHLVEVSGFATGYVPIESRVTFSGALAGFTTINLDGSFQYFTTIADEGIYDAVITDVLGTPISPVESDTIDVPSPSVTLDITDQTATTVTYSGTLTSLDAGYQSIHINGAPIGATLTDDQGNFSFTLARENLGVIEVSETDLWGQTSNFASVAIAAEATLAPLLFNCSVATNFDGSRTLTGQVLGLDVTGLGVRFGGLASLNGQIAYVDANGWFSYTFFLATGETGTASAQINEPGQTSNTVYMEIL